MGVYIKGMEMPTSCYKCDLRRRDGMDIVCPVAHERFSIADVNILEYRLDNCPLAAVPPHGRLGDLDALTESVRNPGIFPPVVTSEVFEFLRNAPTIIQADPPEEE